MTPSARARLRPSLRTTMSPGLASPANRCTASFDPSVYLPGVLIEVAVVAPPDQCDVPRDEIVVVATPLVARTKLPQRSLAKHSHRAKNTPSSPAAEVHETRCAASREPPVPYKNEVASAAGNAGSSPPRAHHRHTGPEHGRPYDAAPASAAQQRRRAEQAAAVSDSASAADASHPGGRGFESP